MNGVNGAAGLWQEARNADGRVYYYNTQTKATQWAKPQELMTPGEVCEIPLSEVMIVLTNIARSLQSTMEGVYGRGWPEVLVQYRDKTKLLGDARGLQECSESRIFSAT